MGKFKTIWTHVKTSLWFVPLIMIVAASGSAFGLVALDATSNLELEQQIPIFSGMTIYFIHHIATGIQAATILSGIAEETTAAHALGFDSRLGTRGSARRAQVEPSLRHRLVS